MELFYPFTTLNPTNGDEDFKVTLDLLSMMPHFSFVLADQVNGQ